MKPPKPRKKLLVVYFLTIGWAALCFYYYKDPESGWFCLHWTRIVLLLFVGAVVMAVVGMEFDMLDVYHYIEGYRERGELLATVSTLERAAEMGKTIKRYQAEAENLRGRLLEVEREALALREMLNKEKERRQNAVNAARRWKRKALSS
ncbi:MAG: hypothetical protein D6681_17320 [Calditrichaeota bacterium]|nr:MAG: hypothetical protein D6681_17320 [Calditrichota bacterium]